MTVLNLFTRMGLIPWLVILLLAAMNVLTLTVAVLKLSLLRRMQRSTRALAPALTSALQENRLDDAVALMHEHPASPLAGVLSDALERAGALLADPASADRAIESAERTVARQQVLLATELKRGLAALATIGATAPFVGLFGTVIGITNSFVGIAATGGGGIEAVAGGVGEALITTAAGLLVAIPALWVYNYLISRLEELFAELSYVSDELIDWLSLRRAGVVLHYDTPVAMARGA
ncbi:MAG TPA: MotA/TolQ/ExbB proton channel family protein [Gemmatimonadales bacterium]|nr:MotA/TolQ/ExbB proton channel family protein [Gemmatimonadales bacterium]